MDLVLCWLIAPVGLLIVTVGLSLLVERLTGFILPWTVRPALGLATAIVIAQFGTATATTAKLTLPAILVLAVAGLLWGREIAGPRPGRAEVGVAAVVFLLFAMPFLVAGEATWAGYIKLDDTATWLAITAHVFEHGRGLGHLEPSTNQQVIEDYLAGSYPIGAFVPMAVMSKLSGQDISFTFQPSMAASASMLALLLFELARRLVRGIGAAALIAVVSSLSALLLGYYLWGGVKELVTAALLPLGPVLAGLAIRADWPGRAWAMLSLTIAALVVVLGPGGALWALPALVPALVVAVHRYGRPGSLRLVTPVAVLSLLLVLPVIFTPVGPFDPLNGGVTGEAELGNLIGPLSTLQVAGIWPSIDFRVDPHLNLAIRILAVLTIAAAAAAIISALRRNGEKAAPFAGYVAGGAVGAFLIIHYGSPWVDAKTLATLSPAVLFAALVGIVSFGQRTEFRLESAVVVTVLVGVVAWGAFLAYQGAWLAPRSHFAELEKIGDRFAGQGPALSTEATIYGPRYYLRKLDAEGASDRRRRLVLLRSGSPPEDGTAVDLDSIQSDELDPYNLLVTRRSPAESRPPAEFDLVYSGDHYDVWQRIQAPGELLEHLPLGTNLDAGATPPCGEVGRLAGLAGEGGTLVAARVGTPIAIEFSTTSSPPGWETHTPYTVTPSGSGTTSSTFDVSQGSYEIWMGGEVFGSVDIYIDGEKVASERGVLDVGGMEYLTTVALESGSHTLDLEYQGADLHPGSAVQPYDLGPLELRPPQGSDLGLVTVAPDNYRRLCGERWDWVEARRGVSRSQGS